MATANPPRPQPRRTDDPRDPAANEDEETGWLLAAALIEARRQGGPRPRDEVMGLLAEMIVDSGAGTVTRAALGLADVASTLLEVCADSLSKAPTTVLRDVLAILRDDG